MTVTFTQGTGFDWNIVVAITAIVGIILSFAISIYTLKQTKRYGLFDKRYALIQYFVRHLADKWTAKPDDKAGREFLVQTYNISLLFDNYEHFFESAKALHLYYIGDGPLPDYRLEFPSHKSVQEAFFEHAMQGLIILQGQLDSSKHSKKTRKLLKI